MNERNLWSIPNLRMRIQLLLKWVQYWYISSWPRLSFLGLFDYDVACSDSTWKLRWCRLTYPRHLPKFGWKAEMTQIDLYSTYRGYTVVRTPYTVKIQLHLCFSQIYCAIACHALHWRYVVFMTSMIIWDTSLSNYTFLAMECSIFTWCRWKSSKANHSLFICSFFHLFIQLIYTTSRPRNIRIICYLYSYVYVCVRKMLCSPHTRTDPGPDLRI